MPPLQRLRDNMESVFFGKKIAVTQVIVGLLWFELTVYRGVRAIQYANH